MVSTCGNCGAVVVEAARFCMNCGHPVAAPVGYSSRFTRLVEVAPAGLVAKMRAVPVTGERKPVTAVFSDVVGSTALAESMDPEDWAGIMNHAFDLMSRALYRYEGTIASLVGDGILAFFGAPIAHEDDPERAVLASLDMIDNIAELRSELQSALGIDFQIRVGINTGEVVVGNVGSDLRYEYTALGDTMNVAARMEAAAPPSGVLVTADTMRFIAGRFEVDDWGEISVKGKTRPVHAFRALKRRVERQSTRGLAGLRSAMVGRDKEIADLEFQFVQPRRGQPSVALVTGEPGLGKSRLVAEFRTAQSQRDPTVRWVEGQCLSYGESLPYHLVIDILRSLMGVSPDASERAVREVLRVRTASLPDVGGERAVSFLEHLMVLGQDAVVAERLEALDPATLQAHYVSAIGRLLTDDAATGPLVVVCEDIHWIDPSSAHVVEQLVPRTAEHRVHWILSRRPGHLTTGASLVDALRARVGDALHEFTLAPLSSDDSRQLVSNLLEIDALPPSTRELIERKSDGNPYFVEEVIRMLIERGVLEKRSGTWTAMETLDSIQIPDTVHGLLLARIDMLPDDARQALLVSSVIGRRFSASVLEHVLASR